MGEFAIKKNMKMKMSKLKKGETEFQGGQFLSKIKNLI